MSKSSPNIFFATFFVFLNYVVGFIIGTIGDILQNDHNDTKKGKHAPLLTDFEDFYQRRIYKRVKDCWNRPITSSPSNYFKICETKRTDDGNGIVITGKELFSLNLSSYNYLGFADNPDHVTENVLKTLYEDGISNSSLRCDYGTQAIHQELEKKIAEFIGKEDAITCAMGFATNTTIIPSLFSKGDLLISDSDNHASIVNGAKSSGAKVKVFSHNDVNSLESIIVENIKRGQDSNKYIPWKKIVIIVEGIYSMEGKICDLPKIVEIKKKYKCYLYVDEAHSIGCLGQNGRGVCEYYGVKTSDVDILMGTFTKSFGSVGGYVASSKEVIQFLRKKSITHNYCIAMSPPCAKQIISAIDVITGKDGSNIGKERLAQIRDNSKFFKKSLIDLGFQVVGDEGSPVLCIMVYYPNKLCTFSRLCLKKGLGVVVVGFPAVGLFGARVRFCLSASHSRKDLEKALEIINEVGTFCMLKYKK